MTTPHEQVQRIGNDHHPKPGPGHHSDPVVGCPWCIDDDRATRGDETIRALNPDEWHLLSAHTARWVLAAAALADPFLADDLAILARVGRMYLDALDVDEANEYLTLPEAMLVTEVREATERRVPTP